MTAYYNEISPYHAQWLRNLISVNLIAPGDVDERSIADVQPDDLKGYTQCHFFAGIGGWSRALRLAGWGDDRHVWTGSCPCQPFSAIGARRGFEDERHLWPEFKRLISERRPSVIFGEQSANAADWLRLVRSDLEAMDFAVGAIPIEAASAGADVLGDRFWFVASADVTELCGESPTREQQELEPDPVAHPFDAGREDNWRRGQDGRLRRVDPSIHWMAHGVPARMGKISGFGNAVDPRPAAAVIKAYIKTLGDENNTWGALSDTLSPAAAGPWHDTRRSA
ncbi:DNA cytosine methyltransferase [Rhizobium leguminosarum]|uniref:DNA cytosine methyltransferase n=1 Tax=Rhizobium leguminosarum TaxID=384 RepID=UPI0003748636|nr:DNA cytosine methyltransferase [Rhizobium leguminosarum]